MTFSATHDSCPTTCRLTCCDHVLPAADLALPGGETRHLLAAPLEEGVDPAVAERDQQKVGVAEEGGDQLEGVVEREQQQRLVCQSRVIDVRRTDSGFAESAGSKDGRNGGLAGNREQGLHTALLSFCTK